MSTYAKIVVGIVCLCLLIAYMVEACTANRDARERAEWRNCLVALQGWGDTTRGSEDAWLIRKDYTDEWLSAHRLTNWRFENDWAKNHRFVDDSIVAVSRAGAYSRDIYDDCKEEDIERTRARLGIPRRPPSDEAYTCYNLMDYWDKGLNVPPERLGGHQTQFLTEDKRFRRGASDQREFYRNLFPALEEVFRDARFIDTNVLFEHCLPVIGESSIMMEKYD